MGVFQKFPVKGILELVHGVMGCLEFSLVSCFV
jgi:hypothetical protein